MLASLEALGATNACESTLSVNSGEIAYPATLPGMQTCRRGECNPQTKTKPILPRLKARPRRRSMSPTNDRFSPRLGPPQLTHVQGLTSAVWCEAAGKIMWSLGRVVEMPGSVRGWVVVAFLLLKGLQMRGEEKQKRVYLQAPPVDAGIC